MHDIDCAPICTCCAQHCPGSTAAPGSPKQCKTYMLSHNSALIAHSPAYVVCSAVQVQHAQGCTASQTSWLQPVLQVVRPPACSSTVSRTVSRTVSNTVSSTVSSTVSNAVSLELPTCKMQQYRCRTRLQSTRCGLPGCSCHSLEGDLRL